jgi:hypothetical protein
MRSSESSLIFYRSRRRHISGSSIPYSYRWENLKSNIMLFGFVCSLNDAASGSEYIAPNGQMVVNNKMERLWKEVVVAWSG